ncbi:MAG: response regulator [Bacteriovorax sp.]|jgi:two-component system chemotaxis response regulator CheY
MAATKTSDKFPVGIKYLIIEDVAIVRTQLVNDIKSLDNTAITHEAANLAEASTLVKANVFDMVICDWNLPDGTGFDFLKSFRKVARFSKIPFIICTTRDDVNNLLDAMGAGANDYVIKPWNLDELENKIASTWGRKK